MVDKRKTIRFDEELYFQIQEAAKSRGFTFSQFVRWASRRVLKQINHNQTLNQNRINSPK